MSLKDLRTRKSLSQTALGAACNTSRDRISLWESGAQKPGLNFQIKLAKALNMPLIELQTLCHWPLTPDVVIVGLGGVQA